MHICTQLLCQMSVKPGCWTQRELESDTWSQEGGHHWKTLNSAAQNWTKPHKTAQNRTQLDNAGQHWDLTRQEYNTWTPVSGQYVSWKQKSVIHCLATLEGCQLRTCWKNTSFPWYVCILAKANIQWILRVSVSHNILAHQYVNIRDFDCKNATYKHINL